MKNNTYGKILLPLLILAAALFSCKSDLDILRDKFRSELLDRPVNETGIKELVSTIRDDGTWPGIDYIDTSNLAFEHSRHYSNMVSMARAYKKEDSPLKGDRELKEALFKALDFWLENDFLCENWWYNQIGTPDAMVSLLLILDRDLTTERAEKMLKIAGRAHLNASGARPSGDRIKIAGILAKANLFKRDETAVDEVINVIEGEIKFAPDEQQRVDGAGNPVGERMIFPSSGRGMQHDFSFHHRADRVNNTLSYGTGYADAFAEWAANVADTKYRFSDESVKLLADYYLDGICKQMIYGKITDPGVRNRDISRSDYGRGSAGTATPERLLIATDYRRAELEDIIKIRKGEKINIPSFAKFFWQTEHFVFQRPDFYTSIRMYSTRNRNMEQPYNGEGLTNHYRADGTNYLSLSGKEYSNIAPVFDFRKVPGATILEGEKMPSEKEIQKRGLTGFVGGVTDGLYGAAVFDFESPHDGIKARKSWFFFDDEYVCLGTGINGSDKKNRIATTLNQCLLDGEVTASSDGKPSVIPAGERALEKVSWVYHDSVGYLFLKPQKISLFNNTAAGTWYSINRQTDSPKEEVKRDVFKLWLDHGTAPANESYHYIVMPSSDIPEIEKYASDPSVEIVSNSRELQSVWHKKLNLGYAVFYSQGSAKFPGDLQIGTDNGCMILVKASGGSIASITVSDPSRSLESLKITVNRKIEKSGENYKTKYDEKTGVTEISAGLPAGKYSGSSVVINL